MAAVAAQESALGLMGRLEPPQFSFPVIRTPAYDALADGAPPRHRVIAVSAPTGYGKTVFLSTLFHRYQAQGVDCLWINLFEDDDNLDRVLRIAEAAVQDDAGGDDVHDVLHQGDAPAQWRIENLLAQLADRGAPVTVFLDNLNHCRDESLSLLLDALAYQSPPGVSLVLASTEALPFNASKIRLAGGLREIDFADLRLGVEGIRELVGEACADRLGAQGLETARELTEGWPAAVRLLQIVLAAEDDPTAALEAFSGADRDVAALLNREVLHRFGDELRDFLLQIALLDRFSAPLCAYATGKQSAAELVARLVERNALIIPLDRRRAWYRLHGLLRDYLLQEAERALPRQRRREILERAAAWSEANSQWAEAIDYALAAGSYELAANMLERVAPMFVRDRGDLQQYIGWAEGLAAQGVQIGFEAAYWYAWALVFYRRYEAARHHADELTARLEAQDAEQFNEADRAASTQRIEVIRIAISIYTDRLDEGRERAERWLAESHQGDPFDVATVAVAATFHLAANFEFADARQHVLTAQSSIGQSDSQYGRAWVTLMAAMVAMGEGEYPSALQQLDAALSRAKGAMGQGAGIVGTLSSVAAKCAVEMDHADQARELAARGLPALPAHGVCDTAIYGLDALIKLWPGHDEDWLSLARVREYAQVYPPRVATSLSCFLVRRYLRLERVEDALLEAARVGLGERGPHKKLTPPGTEKPCTAALLALTEAELAVSCGHFRRARAVLDREQKAARRQGRWADLVDLALGEVAVLVCSHHPEPAARPFTRAITSAAKRRLLFPFKQRANLVAGLVNETKPQSWNFASQEERGFFNEVCRGLPTVNSGLLDQLEDLECEAALAETPTARELELVKLIEAGLTNQQIADRISVSVSTVKWHLYNLYTKLGVSSRSAALARARALNLLSR